MRKSAEQYKLVLAENFLRNISLDGSYEDTQLSIFNRPGLPISVIKSLRVKCGADLGDLWQPEDGQDDNLIVPPPPPTPASSINLIPGEDGSLKEVTFAQNVHVLRSKLDVTTAGGMPTINVDSPSSPGADTVPRLELDDLVKENMEELQREAKKKSFFKSLSQGNSSINSGFFSQSLQKMKTASHTPERRISSPPPAPRRFDPKNIFDHYRSLSWKKKKHKTSQESTSWVSYSPPKLDSKGKRLNVPEGASPSKGSSANLSEHGSISEDNNHAKSGGQKLLSSLRTLTRLDRVCLVSSAHNPLVIYSVLEYQKSRPLPDYSRREEGSRTRTSSGSDNATGLRPFDFHSEEEVSYSRLLIPYGGILFNASSSTGAMQVATKRFHSEDTDFLTPKSRIRDVSRSSSCEPQAPSSPQQRSDVKFHFESGERLTELEFLDEDPEDEEAAGPMSKTYHFEGSRGKDYNSIYDPTVLEDPDFGSGEHRTTMKFPGYVATVVDFVNPEELKKEANEKFKERFPHVQITLSKIRSIKREMRFIAQEVGLDPLTLAQGFVYFEKLIFKALVNKQNRKQVAAVSLLLSAKLNDVKGAQIQALMEKTESTFRWSKKEIIVYEIPVVVALEFTLLVPDWEVFPHFQKLHWAT